MPRSSPPFPPAPAGRRSLLWIVPLLALDFFMPAISGHFGWPRSVTLFVQLVVLVMMGSILWSVWRAARKQLGRKK